MKNLTVIPLRMPIEQIVKSIRVVLAAESDLRKLGSDQDSTTFQEKRKSIIDAAQEKLKAAHEEADRFIWEQVTPNGNDILGEGAADVALLNLGLINSAGDLKRILEKHNNAAFRALAARYASERDWEGFDYMSKTESVRSFTDQVFDGLSRAVYSPGQILSEQYTKVADEYSRIAAAYDLSQEFSESNGKVIAEVISSYGGSD